MQESPSKSYRRYVLFLLTVVYVFNFVDRQILVILQEPIKAELGLSDTQLGLMTGFAFALFYVCMGIPIARWADVGNRRNIISIALVVWSTMTALSGFVQNFTQMLLARIGVGVGEAGASPPSHSILSDYYAPEERGAAMSIYSMGLYIGILVGLLAGGWLNEFYGWRMAFLIVGLPGILLALVVRFTLREPVRGAMDPADSESEVEAKSSMRETIAYMWHSKAFRWFSVASGFSAFAGYAGLTFFPSFLIRSHGMSIAEVGTVLGLMIGLSGIAGSIISGYLADRFGREDKRWYLWVPGLGVVLAFPLAIIALSLDSIAVTLALLFLNNLFVSFYLGPTIAIAHHLVKPQMRAMTSAVLFLILNIIGLGCGPVVAGMISDALSADYGYESLRYSLMYSSCALLVAGACYWRASTHLKAAQRAIA